MLSWDWISSLNCHFQEIGWNGKDNYYEIVPKKNTKKESLTFFFDLSNQLLKLSFQEFLMQFQSFPLYSENDTNYSALLPFVGYRK